MPRHVPKRECEVVESLKLEDHSIVIRVVRHAAGEHYEVLVDGKKLPFLQTDDGYLVGYAKAEKLLDAVKFHVARRFGIDPKGGE